VEVARAGVVRDPPEPVPSGLQPFLQFARLPAAALAAARRALDADESFRARVAETTDEGVVGREGWLFLTRPPGWEAELDAAARAYAEHETAIDEQRAEQDARRNVARLESTIARLEAELAGVRQELAAAEAARDEERRAGRDAIARSSELEARLHAVRGERDRHRDDAQSAAREVARLKAVLAERRGGATIDSDALTRAVADASHAADRLQLALHAAAIALRPADEGVEDPEDEDGVAEPAPTPRSPLAQPPSRDAERRRPARLPPGVLDDSDEAANALVRVNGMVLLVDGYNVAMLGWPSRPISEQRTRLVDALAQLVARTGADVEVIFDGTGVPPPGPLTDRRGVRVSFSPPDVEADDVLITRAESLPVHRPVTVASNDRRVQDGARGAGANVISSAQLLAVLRH
jgi:predicted RNA-binding protein with PIN domain